jgi:hypothetical protein
MVRSLGKAQLHSMKGIQCDVVQHRCNKRFRVSIICGLATK